MRAKSECMYELVDVHSVGDVYNFIMVTWRPVFVVQMSPLAKKARITHNNKGPPNGTLPHPSTLTSE